MPEPTGGRRAGGSAAVGAGILLSRISGLVRERAIGHFFGLSVAADAFTAAVKIPNLLQNLLGEGVLSASFIPTYSRLLEAGREREAGQVAGAVLGALAVVTGLLVVLGVTFAEPLARVFAPGFADDPTTFALTVRLIRIVTPGVGLLVLSAWCLGILNSHRRFFTSYVAPVLWNGAQIVLLVTFGVTVYTAATSGGPAAAAARADLVVVLGWATVVGGALQLLVQVPAVVRLTRGLRPSLRTDLPGVRETASAFVPVVAGRGVVQLSAWFDTILASFLAVGALTSLRYAQTLYVLPISLFGMSVAAAELPELSRMTGSTARQVRTRLDAGLARIAFFVVPTVVAFVVVGDLIVGALYQTGRFSRLDTLQVWVVLGAYSVGLLAGTSSRLLQSALYGLGDPRTPAVVAAVRVVASAVVGAVLMLQLERVALDGDGVVLLGDLPAWRPLPRDVGAGGVAPLGAAGLALAAGLASWIEFVWLRAVLRRRGSTVRMAGGNLARTALAAAVIVPVGLAGRVLLADWPPLAAGVVTVGTCGGAYLTAAAALRSPELRRLRAVVRRRRR